MKWRDYIDAEEVQKAISTLQQPGEVFEIRVIGTAKKDILSGYFRDADTLLEAFDKIDIRQRNVYITLNEVKDECFSRAQSEQFLKNTQTSSDSEIVKYRWLFIDFDPVRSAGISSSDQELALAQQLAEEVRCYLRELQFKEPVYALSGNGYHLLYRIDVPNTEQGRALVANCLKALSETFDSDKVKIDTTNSNPSRICKLHGTLAQKGRWTQNRPHRMSRILSTPEPIEITPSDTLKVLADKATTVFTDLKPKQTVPLPRKEFDVVDFMARHGMTYREGATVKGRVFNLDECPFDPNHKDGDAKIFLYPDGAVAFKCHHNSCSHYRWQDVREKFEPGVYEAKLDDDRYDQGFKEHLLKKEIEDAVKPQKKSKCKIRKLKTAEALMERDLPDPRVFIGVGDELPLLVEGTCILSAKPKLGKSWFALAMCLSVARGEDFLGYKTRKASTLYLDLETSETLQQRRIRKMLKGAQVPKNFYIESETNSLNDGFCDQLEAYLQEDPEIGVVVIDVFAIIRTESKSRQETEYSHAYRDLTPLNALALKYHISIILVCHDRKAVDPDDPFTNILGSTGLQGAASQMISMFRRTKNEPIHISVKGKTIDGLPELSVKFEDAVWTVVEDDNPEREREKMADEYKKSKIREAVLAITNDSGRKYDWQGQAGELRFDAAADYQVSVNESPKEIGLFLHRHVGRFLDDGVVIRIIKNGTGPKIYKFSKSPLMTIDEKDNDH